MGERGIDSRHARPEPSVPVDDATAHVDGKREFGSARGLIRMADDFDAPLDDFWECLEPESHALFDRLRHPPNPVTVAALNDARERVDLVVCRTVDEVMEELGLSAPSSPR